MRVEKKILNDEIQVNIFLSPKDIPYVLKDLAKTDGLLHFLTQPTTKIVTALKKVLSDG